MKNTYLLILLLFFALPATSIAQSITLLQQGKPTSIRGLSVVDDNVAWVSGSRGYYAITNDGGKTWDWQQVKGYEKSDFRDIEAFSNKAAVIMSSGTPALILKTVDGGATWQEKYRNTDTTYFLDAMDFNNPKHGIVLGDPIKNKFVLLETNDGAETWHPFKNPPDAMPGEACFAASGTCLRIDDYEIHIVSGGSVARHLKKTKSSQKWFIENMPLAHGAASKGGFSIAIVGGRVAVGGDYAKDKINDSISAFFEADIRARYKLSSKQPAGFQSCVEFINNKTYLSTGTPGSNITIDGGETWTKIDAISYNVCRKAKHGKLLLLAGDRGKIGILKL